MMRSEEKPQLPANPQDRCRAIHSPERSTWPDETSESTSAISRGRSELGMRWYKTSSAVARSPGGQSSMCGAKWVMARPLVARNRKTVRAADGGEPGRGTKLNIGKPGRPTRPGDKKAMVDQ